MAKRFLFMVIARGQDEEEKSQPGHQAERLRDLHKKSSLNGGIFGLCQWRDSRYSIVHPLCLMLGNGTIITEQQGKCRRRGHRDFPFDCFHLQLYHYIVLWNSEIILENFIKKSESCFYILHNQWGYLFKLRKIAQICEFRFWIVLF